jgi:peptide/nickel transport system substrate-binding protein
MVSTSVVSLAEATEPTKGGTLTVALSYEPDTLNVYSTHLMGDVQAMAVEGLLVPDENMQYVPALALEVPTVENGLIVLNEDGTMDITYNLRQGVLWHDGTPFTSKDVKATWEALCDETWDAEGAAGATDITSIDLPDDYTVVCHYSYQTLDYAAKIFTFGIMPAHLIEGADMNDMNNAYNSTMVGTGPYKFVEWVPGEYLYLAANENYWGEGPYLDGVYFRFVPDENARITMLKAGEVDFAYGISIQNYNEVNSIPGYKVESKAMNSWVYMDFNCARPGLAENVVRQAISMGVDKQAIVDQLLNGVPVAWYQPWMPGDPYHVDGFESKYVYNPEAAIALLEANGWVLGSDGVREKDGLRLEFDISCAAGNAEREAIELVVQAQLSMIGIKINIANLAASALSSTLYAGEYDIAIGGWITTPSPSRTNFYAIGGANNRGKWASEEFTELSALIDAEMDVEKRKEYVAQALEVFDEGLPEMVMYNIAQLVVMNEKLEGVKLNSTNMTHFCQSASWYLEQ